MIPSSRHSFARARLSDSSLRGANGPARIGRPDDRLRGTIQWRCLDCFLRRNPGLAPVLNPGYGQGRTGKNERKRRTRNAGRCIRYDHATRTNVAIRPRFRAWRGPRRGPLTSRRSATALTEANQRRRSAPDALPGTRLKDGCCPSPPVPVQRQSRRPVMMPAGRIPGAARERNVSSRPREPHSPHRRKHPRGDVLLSEMIRKNCIRKWDYMQA